MILTMAAIAVTTRKRLERTCPKCGKKQILSTQRDQRSCLMSMLRDTDSAEEEGLN